MANTVILWLYFVVCFAFASSKAICKPPPLDIALVIDRTRSVGEDNYKTMLEAVRKLIKQYDVGKDNIRFALVTFAGVSKVRAKLNDPAYQSQKGLMGLIDYMEHTDSLGSPTRTDLALELVSSEVFVLENGDRLDSPNVMIVFTDGGKHETAKSYSEVLPPLVDKGVFRIAVGIGKNIKSEELETIAGSSSRVVSAKSFEDLNNQLEDILEKTCNIDGGYTVWGEWSECPQTCGGGIHWRYRNCTNPPPKNNGKTCEEQEELGPSEESAACNTEGCAIDGGYTEWSEWGECSQTCGGGMRWRTRNCTNPSPENGGKTCEEQKLGPGHQTEQCNTNKCPADCPGMDIALVIDKTKSIGKKQYKKMLDIIKGLISLFKVGKDETHFAVVTFAGKAKIRVSFDQSKYYKKRALKNLLNTMKQNFRLRQPTKVDKAIKLVDKKVFNVNMGDRPESPDVMIIFTDGGKREPSEPFSSVIAPLEAKGVHRIVVGFGNKLDVAKLEEIAGKGQAILVKDLDDLRKELKSIRDSACEVKTRRAIHKILLGPSDEIDGYNIGRLWKW